MPLGSGHGKGEIAKKRNYAYGENMKGHKPAKPTLLETINKILDSDLPLSTRNEIARYYLLPRLGRTTAIIEDKKTDIGTVERPNAEEVMIENNPKLKAEYKATEEVMTGKTEEDE